MSFKNTIILSVLFSAAGTEGFAMPAADNDESYKLPLFIPKAAMPAGGKVKFEDQKGENDEMYTLPKRAAVKPSSLSPSAGGDKTAKTYNQQYEEYQQQMKVYNEQMAEYKKQLAAQNSQAPGDNDTSYVLPGQYSETKKALKPRPVVAAQPKPQPAPAAQPKAAVAAPVQQQVAPVQQQAIPQPQPAPAPQAAPPVAARYNQQYNYSDQQERGATPAHPGNSFPNYYQ